jgi:hypothetical protein
MQKIHFYASPVTYSKYTLRQMGCFIMMVQTLEIPGVSWVESKNGGEVRVCPKKFFSDIKIYS